MAPGAHGVDLVTDKIFRNFTVRYEFMVPDNSNSGFYLRGRHEIQILVDAASGKPSVQANGAIYGFKARAPAVVRRPPQPAFRALGGARGIAPRFTRDPHELRLLPSLRIVWSREEAKSAKSFHPATTWRNIAGDQSGRDENHDVSGGFAVMAATRRREMRPRLAITQTLMVGVDEGSR